MAKDTWRTLTVTEGGMGRVEETGNLLYDVEMEELAKQGRLYQDGEQMSLVQLRQKMYPATYAPDDEGNVWCDECVCAHEPGKCFC